VPAWPLFLGFVVALLGLLAWRWIVGRREPAYLAVCDYWVYVAEPRLPDQTALMERMVSSNPHNRPGRPAIGAREGMLFTDIRLRIAVVRKDRNPQAFRPDLFDPDAEPTAEVLERIGEASGIVRARYVSDVVLKDDRHLQFLPHAADALVDLCGGSVVFDHVTAAFWPAETLKEELGRNNAAARPDVHVRVLWRATAELCRVETRGLRKIGQPEIVTEPLPADHEVLAQGLVWKLVHVLWREPASAWPIEVEDHGDRFRFEDRGREDGKRRVGLLRILGGSDGEV
jgi:hypothetical protein